MNPARAGKGSEKGVVAHRYRITLPVKGGFCLKFKGSAAAKDLQIIGLNRVLRESLAETESVDKLPGEIKLVQLTWSR